jgi:hypothetical protein
MGKIASVLLGNEQEEEREGYDDGDNDFSSNSIFRIADELVQQVDKTKKMILVMIIAIVVAVPISWHLSPILTGNPDNFRIAGYVTILIALAFLAIGIRQWLVLSKWTKRYKNYQALQRKIDEKLDFEKGDRT